LESNVQRSGNYCKAGDEYKKAELGPYKGNGGRPKTLTYCSNWVSYYFKVEDFTAAEPVLFEAMKEDGDSPQPYADLGVLYSRKGDYTKAVQYFEQALQKDIDDLTVRSNLAEACLKAKLADRSEAEYKKILGVTALHVESHIGLGEVFIPPWEMQETVICTMRR
jgi:tetratricopeptide (TPR) repeat protein